jgi:predicted dehydrogenase
MRSDQYLPIQGAYASSWRADAGRAGAGVLLEHSIHDLDILDLIVGPIQGIRCQTRSFHGLPGIEDVAEIQFELPSGALSGLSTIWHDILERPEARRVEIFCERLWCALDGHYFNGPVTWRRLGEAQRTLGKSQLAEAARPLASGGFNEDAAFVHAVLHDRPTYPDFSIGLRAHQLADAAYRSAQSGGRFVLTPPAQDRHD